jgi:hypothetical protein
MINLYNNNSNITENQSIYDSFNNFIFSKDRNVFNKLYSKFMFYNMTKHLSGDIIECGVFKGSGLLAWLKILDMHEPNSIKKAIGFDFFDPNFVDKINNEIDKETMKQVFSRCNDLDKDELSISGVRQKINNANINDSKFELVEGDIIKTSKDFVDNRPGFRISILNMDLDLDDPTYLALNAFWPRIVDGGIVIFDEYAYHSWSEANAVDKFVKEKRLFLHRTNIKTPTAYLIKE